MALLASMEDITNVGHRGGRGPWEKEREREREGERKGVGGSGRQHSGREGEVKVGGGGEGGKGGEGEKRGTSHETLSEVDYHRRAISMERKREGGKTRDRECGDAWKERRTIIEEEKRKRREWRGRDRGGWQGRGKRR